jgi:hypothetical protein
MWDSYRRVAAIWETSWDCGGGTQMVHGGKERSLGGGSTGLRSDFYSNSVLACWCVYLHVHVNM